MLKYLVLGLFTLLAVGAASEASAQYEYGYGHRHYYSSWSYHNSHNYYYSSYHYKPYSAYEGYRHHYCVYRPAQPRYVYYYNPEPIPSARSIGDGLTWTAKKAPNTLCWRRKTAKRNWKTFPRKPFPNRAPCPKCPIRSWKMTSRFPRSKKPTSPN
jgi:hypothetical protein